MRQTSQAAAGRGQRVLSSKRFVAVAAAACLAGYIVAFGTGVADAPIRSDGFSYYVYLPAWFIFHDPSLAAVARDCCGGHFPEWTNINRWPATRRWVNAHPIGVAIMQAPLFLVAHALTRWTNLSPSGFSVYYQHAVGISGLLAVVAGLWVLRGLLLRHYTDGITTATLATLLFATNLYHYATLDSAWSHAYTFLLVAAFLYLTELWHERPTQRLSAWLGAVAGLIVLVRHPNALYLLFLPLYGVRDFPTLRSAVTRLVSEWRMLAVMAAVVAALVLPQLLIYYAATGRPLVSSYSAVGGFHFGAPHVRDVLFSVQKGLFFWSPILLLAVAGLALLRGTARNFLLPSVVVLAATVYLIASWFDWQFGASYGHRGFVDAFPFLAIGLAALLERASGRVPSRVAVTAVCVAAACLSMFQMLQYWYGILPMSDLTWPEYRRVFLEWR
jgi:hypothetical protein